MRGFISITLKSDLCAASGDGFSLSIDTDICADRYGLPFIPSRRLKGCLREAANYIGCDRIDSIFGVTGNDRSGSLRIDAARLKNYDSLAAQAESSKYSAEQVLALFTSVKASTAIENDTAKENSLRFTRVVNHYSPFDGNELTFVSEIEYSKEDTAHLEMICKALRNIGYKRTRGYGSVKCIFVSDRKIKGLDLTIPNDDKEYELNLTVKLVAPAMFPGKSSNETLDYIPGSAVLGAFAAGYAAEKDKGFEDLFLKKNLRFSNMYISDEGKVSEPAPAVLGKTKDTGEIRFVFSEDNELDKPLPKPFKSSFMIGGKELKPKKETIYHHSNNNKKLYTQESLSEGQMFSGRITGTGKALQELLPIVESGRLSLGKSKTAQYSSCKIIAAECNPANMESIPAGEIYALLCSDVLLLDDNAQFSTDINVLASALGVELTDEDKSHSFLKYHTVMGYISVGRYKRSHIRAFEKGSVIRFTSNKELPQYITVGERQNEGFGLLKLCMKDDLMKLGRTVTKLPDDQDVNSEKLSEIIKKDMTKEALRKAAIDYAEDKYQSIEKIFNPSFVGRLLLMVNQAENENDLKDRVASVKDEKKRKAAQTFLKGAKELYCEEWQEFFILALTIIKYKMKEAGK